MKKQLPSVQERTGLSFSQEEVETIKRAIMPEGTTDAHLKLFMAQCTRTGLDPFNKQIYCFMQQGKLVIGTSVDGFRVIAERTNKYAGQVGPFWCGGDGAWVDVWLKSEPPVAAKVGVVRTDFKEPLWAVARFDSYKQEFWDKASGSRKLSPPWQKQPDNMLAKAAECLALRKAFPNDLSGLYGSEEKGAFEAEEVHTVHVDPPTLLAANPKTEAVIEIGKKNKPLQTVVTEADLLILLDQARGNNYGEEEVSEWIEDTYGLTEETILTMTPGQLERAREHFLTKREVFVV